MPDLVYNRESILYEKRMKKLIKNDNKLNNDMNKINHRDKFNVLKELFEHDDLIKNNTL